MQNSVMQEKIDQQGDLDATLESTLQNEWNAKVVDYDADRYDFHKWILQRINDYGYPVEDLTTLHEVVPLDEVYTVTKRLCKDCNLPSFREKMLDFTRDVVVKDGALELPVGVQRFPNIRIMLPSRPQSIFPFHTGLLYGHGIASRSLWMPMTDVTADEDYTASMQIIDVDKSRELVKYATDNCLSVDDMSELFEKSSWPLKAGPGKAVFFTQENIHGNFVNVTGKTRVSMDFRVAEARFGDKLAKKIPGGYFEIIPDEGYKGHNARYEVGEKGNGRPNLLYLASGTPGTEKIPVHLQRYMVYEYCKNKELHFDFELFELEDMQHLPTLHHIIDKLKCNAVLYSVFSLPKEKAFRTRILDAVLETGLMMHFVNEDMVIRNSEDRDAVEAVLEFGKYSA